MFLLNSFQPVTLRRHFTRSALALFIMFCLSLSLLFSGCVIDPNDEEIINNEVNDDEGDDDVISLDSRLIGTFKESFYGDYFTITSTHLTYTTPDYIDPDNHIVWGGEIVHAANFSANAGIIIILYDADKKQQWTNWIDMSDMTPAGKDYYGIYFEDLSQAGVKLSQTNDQANNYGPSETASLQEAIDRFTMDNMYDWAASGLTPIYSRQ